MTGLAAVLRSRAFYAHWLVLFLFWYTLSGFNKAFYLVVGALSCGVVAALTYDMQFTEQAHERDRSVHFYALPWHRLFVYALWLLREIVLANWAVLKVVFDPALPADPALIRYRTRLQSSFGRTLLANSITLTPGTITVDIVGDEFIVHALVADESAVAGIASIEARIAQTLAGLESPREVTS